MKGTSKLYETEYYHKGEDRVHVSELPIRFWGNRGEWVHREASSLEGKTYKDLKKMVKQAKSDGTLDHVDVELICRVAISVMVTDGQLTSYMQMAGYDVTQQEIRKKADCLIEKEFLARYEIRGNWFFEESKLAAYRITRLGQKLAMQEGVYMHKGNCCQTFQQRLESNLWDGSVQIRRMLMANDLALDLIRDGRVQRIEFMTTLRLGKDLLGEYITRSAMTAYLEDDNVMLFEVFRRDSKDPQAQDAYIRDKIIRYLRLVRHPDFIEDNCLKLKKYPKLYLFCEDILHTMKIKEITRKIMEENPYIGEADPVSIVFTNDMGLDFGIVYDQVFYMGEDEEELENW